jgi:hypothetical protein
MFVLVRHITVDMVVSLRPQPHSQQSRQALELTTPVGGAPSAISAVNGEEQPQSRLLEASYGRSVRSDHHPVFYHKRTRRDRLLLASDLHEAEPAGGMGFCHRFEIAEVWNVNPVLQTDPEEPLSCLSFDLFTVNDQPNHARSFLGTFHHWS